MARSIVKSDIYIRLKSVGIDLFVKVSPFKYLNLP